jgi:aminoglycoside phosphotransferase (APT) family kinase protein
MYVPLPGRSLDAMAGSTTMIEGLADAGRWLSRLHRSEVDLPRVLDASHEAESAASWAALVGERHCEIAAPAASLARVLAAAVPAPAGRPVPIHKDFQYQHVIVSDSVGVVDLDEARMGDPAADVAHFAAYLRLLAVRADAADGVADAWARSFCDAYGSDTGTEFAWYAAHTCMKIAKQLTTGRGPRPRPEGGARKQQLDWVLREGLAWLGA